jgi:hypothetical protein
MSAGRGLNKPPKGPTEDGASSPCYKFMGLRCRGGGGVIIAVLPFLGLILGATAVAPGDFSPNFLGKTAVPGQMVIKRPNKVLASLFNVCLYRRSIA